MLDFGTVSTAYGVHHRSLRGQVRHDLVSRQARRAPRARLAGPRHRLR
ncbi:hypothetical protein [Nocardioides convexus]|nr:hypothetical protein [Nocardioides convexus]